MKKGITYIRFVRNQVQIGTNKRNTSWKGRMKHNLGDNLIKRLREYIISNDLKDLGHFLNYPCKTKDSLLIVIELLWAFSKNKSINVKADDSYAKRISQKGIKQINKMLLRARRKELRK